MSTEESIIEGVRQFPCLWQVKSAIYRDLRAKENAWNVVATMAETPAEECRRTWRRLRDRFVRELKTFKVRRTGDPPPQSQWPLFNLLGFLEETVRHRRYPRLHSLLEIVTICHRTTANFSTGDLSMNERWWNKLKLHCMCLI